MKIICDEIDLINNVNILSIFAMSGSQQKLQIENLKITLDKSLNFKLLYDSDGKTPFDRSQKESNIYIMKAYLKHLREKIEDGDDDLYHALFSDALLGYTMKSDSAWAIEHMDETLFQENRIKDRSETSVSGKIFRNNLFKSWSKTLMHNMVEKVVDFNNRVNRPIVFEVSRFPVVTVPGSSQSIALIEVLLEAQDEVFDTKISYIIEEKWYRCVHRIR